MEVLDGQERLWQQAVLEGAEDGALVRDVEAHRRRDWCGIVGSRHGFGHAHEVASVIVAVAPS